MPNNLARVASLMKIITLRGVVTLVLTLVFTSVIAQSKAGRAANALEAVSSFSKVVKGEADRPKSKYKPGDCFNPGGYEIGSRYGRVYLKCFSDNDTLFYLQKPYHPNDDGRKYYFLIINKEVKDSILDNALNKNKHKLMQRYSWMNDLLNMTMIDNIENPKSPWTKHATISNGQINGRYYGSGWVPLTYQRAVRAYNAQRHGISGTELLGALMLMNWLSGNNGNGEYKCSCGLSFPDLSSLRSHENAVHDK